MSANKGTPMPTARLSPRLGSAKSPIEKLRESLQKQSVSNLSPKIPSVKTPGPSPSLGKKLEPFIPIFVVLMIAVMIGVAVWIYVNRNDSCDPPSVIQQMAGGSTAACGRNSVLRQNGECVPLHAEGVKMQGGGYVQPELTGGVMLGSGQHGYMTGGAMITLDSGKRATITDGGKALLEDGRMEKLLFEGQVGGEYVLISAQDHDCEVVKGCRYTKNNMLVGNIDRSACDPSSQKSIRYAQDANAPRVSSLADTICSGSSKDSPQCRRPL